MGQSKDDDTLQWSFSTFKVNENDKEIYWEEYRNAAKTLETEERVFIHAVNFAIVGGTAVGSILIGTLDVITATISSIVPKSATLIVLILAIVFFCVHLLRYFSERRRAIVFASRKIIVLRRVFGVRYQILRDIIPNWRIEGADDPFVIKFYSGLKTDVMLPCWIIAGISAVTMFYVLAGVEGLFPMIGYGEIGFIANKISGRLNFITATVFSVAWFIAACLTYREQLYEKYESLALLICKLMGRSLRIGLMENTERIIYDTLLAVDELKRNKISLFRIKKMLVAIEDQNFFLHNGLCIRSMVRAFRDSLCKNKSGGGSTITQQLARSLFVREYSKRFRRKMVEVPFALWFNKQFGKDRQLEMYLASVRYEQHVFGLMSAMMHYFNEVKHELSPAECFFLIERVSNTRSRLLSERVAQTINRVRDAELLSNSDVEEIVGLYEKAIISKTIVDTDNRSLDNLKFRLEEYLSDDGLRS